VHPYVKWVKFREKFEETNVRREAMIKEIAEFLKTVMSKYTLHQRDPSPETASFVKIKDDDESEIEEEEAAERFGRKHYGIDPYLSKMRLLDTRYGIRREGDHLKICNSTVTVDNMSNIIIKGKEFKGTEDLWKLLTHKTWITTL